MGMQITGVNGPMPILEKIPVGTSFFRPAEPLKLESGSELSNMVLAYETWGALNEDKSNAIVLHHALSVSSHARSTDENPDRGWWEEMIGPGKALDTDRYFIICMNNLGSCFGSSGPVSVKPDSDHQYRADFPDITIGDMARSQRLLVQHMGIGQLAAIVGSSMGAMVSLSWAIEYPDDMRDLLLISGSYKAYPANIANRSIQRDAIRMDGAWQNGSYTNNSDLMGFRLARKMGLFSYRNSAEWNRKFDPKIDPKTGARQIIDYIEYNAGKFVNYFDANSYLALTGAMDMYDVTAPYQSNRAAFQRVTARTLIVSVASDILFTPQQQREMYDELISAGAKPSWIDHKSDFGHDAFLVETNAFTAYIQDFLQ